jgi:hypothetical protein
MCGLRADTPAIGTVEGDAVDAVLVSATANIHPSPAVDSHPEVTRAVPDVMCGLRADATVASNITFSSTGESLFQWIIFITFLFGFLIGLFSLGPIITGVCSLQHLCFPFPFFHLFHSVYRPPSIWTFFFFVYIHTIQRIIDFDRCSGASCQVFAILVNARWRVNLL